MPAARRLLSLAAGTIATLATTLPGAAGEPVASGHGWSLYRDGSPPASRPATHPALLLLGGGGDVDDAFRWFLSHAGNGSLLVLRATGSDGYHGYILHDLQAAAQVSTLVLTDRAASADPTVLATIAAADAVFLAGGDQARYLRQWPGTSLAAALDAHVAAGRPIGGTSAGLAALGRYHYAALGDAPADEALSSDETLRNPFHHRITLTSGFLSIPALDRVITDSHFSQRNRLGRLAVFLARLTSDLPGGSPPLLGVGVDERTALCIGPDHQARVIGEGSVHLVALATPLPALTAGLPVRDLHVHVTSVPAGGSWKWLSAAPASAPTASLTLAAPDTAPLPR